MAHPVAPGPPWRRLAVAETVACALNAVRKADPQVGETTVVLGAGPVRLLITALLGASGCRVIVSEVKARRAAVAERIGASMVVGPGARDLRQAVPDETGGRGAEIVVEAVGPLFRACLDLARFGGSGTIAAGQFSYTLSLRGGICPPPKQSPNARVATARLGIASLRSQ